MFLLAMAEMLPGRPLDGWLPPRQRVWVEFLLATPVVFWAGWPLFQRAWQSVQHRSPNMFTLIGIGVGVAYGYSVVATLIPESFPATFRAHGIVAVYFEAAAVITALLSAIALLIIACPCARIVARHDEERSAESLLRVLLQRIGGADRGGESR